MKPLYREINTLRILPLDFMHNLGILLKWDAREDEVLSVVGEYHNWAMGHEVSIIQGVELYKAFCLLGDNTKIQEYNYATEVWKRNNTIKA